MHDDRMVFSEMRDSQGRLYDWMYQGDCICGTPVKPGDGDCEACKRKRDYDTKGRRNHP